MDFVTMTAARPISAPIATYIESAGPLGGANEGMAKIGDAPSKNIRVAVAVVLASATDGATGMDASDGKR
jgi:hypothetical protein